jgi:hypothetical protein
MKQLGFLFLTLFYFTLVAPNDLQAKDEKKSEAKKTEVKTPSKMVLDDPARFQVMKTTSLKGLDERIAILQETKSCMEKSKDAKELRNCRQVQRDKMRANIEGIRQQKKKTDKK